MSNALGLNSLTAQIKTTAMQDPLWNAVEIDLSKIIVWTNRREVVVDDALDNHVITILKGIEVMKHKTIWSLKNARLLTSETTTISRY